MALPAPRGGRAGGSDVQAGDAHAILAKLALQLASSALDRDDRIGMVHHDGHVDRLASSMGIDEDVTQLRCVDRCDHRVAGRHAVDASLDDFLALSCVAGALEARVLPGARDRRRCFRTVVIEGRPFTGARRIERRRGRVLDMVSPPRLGGVGRHLHIAFAGHVDTRRARRGAVEEGGGQRRSDGRSREVRRCPVFCPAGRLGVAAVGHRGRARAHSGRNLSAGRRRRWGRCRMRAEECRGCKRYGCPRVRGAIGIR